MNTVKDKLQKQEQLSFYNIFRNEDGAIDLASIMVGVIVIGMIGGVIAATVFAVIPWTQDKAAKQQLDSIVSAENAYMGLSSTTPPSLPAGAAANSYADSAGLATASLLATNAKYCVVTTNGGKGYQAFSASASGSIWNVTDSNSSPSKFTDALPSVCQSIAPASPPAPVAMPIGASGYQPGPLGHYEAGLTQTQGIFMKGPGMPWNDTFDLYVKYTGGAYPNGNISKEDVILYCQDRSTLAITPEFHQLSLTYYNSPGTTEGKVSCNNWQMEAVGAIAGSYGAGHGLEAYTNQPTGTQDVGFYGQYDPSLK